MPTSLPSGQPSVWPSARPTLQPTSAPTSAPSAFTGQWGTPVEMNSKFTLSKLAVRGDEIWSCGAGNNNVGGCVTLDDYAGAVSRQFDMPWATTTSALVTNNNEMVFAGRKDGDNVLADCQTGTQLVCGVLILSDTAYYSAVIVPFTASILYVGARGTYAASSVLDSSGGVTAHYVYRALNMKSVELVHSASVSNFAGGFVAGTAVADGVALMLYLVLGWIHSTTGSLTALHLYPASGAISDITEAVQALAVESTGPDTFIAGGVELSDKDGVHAYMMRANALFRNIPYTTRYVNSDVQSRRKLTDSPTYSIVRGIAVVIPAIFLVVDHMDLAGNMTTASVLKVEARDGSIIQQVRISSEVDNIVCSDITSTSTGVVIVCTISSASASMHSVLLYADRSLKFRALPAGFAVSRNATFRAESVQFKMSALAVTTSKTSVTTRTSAYSSDNTSPTYGPTPSPTVRPSTQMPTALPSEPPSRAPAVSAYPTSTPSTVQPTHTRKPSSVLTVKPSVVVTVQPSAQPSAIPSPSPTPQPSATPSMSPTRLPSTAPTRKPSIHSTCRPTRVPTLKPTLVSAVSIPPVPQHTLSPEPEASRGANTAPSYVIAVSVVGAALCLILGTFLYYRHYSGREEENFDRLTKIGPSSEQIRVVQKIMHQRATMSSAVHRSNKTSTGENKVAPGPPSVASSSSVAVSSLHSSELSSQYDSGDENSYNSYDTHSSHLTSSGDERSEFSSRNSSSGDERGLHLPRG